MPKLTKKATRYGRTYGRTDPNYRKALLLKNIYLWRKIFRKLLKFRNFESQMDIFRLGHIALHWY